MRILLLLPIFLLSCQDSFETKIKQLPLLTQNQFSGQGNYVFEKQVDLSKTDFQQKLAKVSPSLTNIFGLGKIELHESDSTYLKNFEIILIQSNTSKGAKKALVSYSKTDGSIINVAAFDNSRYHIDNFMWHSSSENHDGMYIELVSHDSMDIVYREVDIFESGKMILREDTSESKIFEHLNQTNPFTGKYSIKTKDWKIIFELKDGTDIGSYAFQMFIYSPKGCSESFINLNWQMRNNCIEFGDFKLKFQNEEHKLTNTNYKNTCDEILDINFFLEKTE